MLGGRNPLDLLPPTQCTNTGRDCVRISSTSPPRERHLTPFAICLFFFFFRNSNVTVHSIRSSGQTAALRVQACVCVRAWPPLGLGTHAAGGSQAYAPHTRPESNTHARLPTEITQMRNGQAWRRLSPDGTGAKAPTTKPRFSNRLLKSLCHRPPIQLAKASYDSPLLRNVSFIFLHIEDLSKNEIFCSIFETFYAQFLERHA